MQISERQYIWTAVRALAKAQAWIDIQQLFTTKVSLALSLCPISKLTVVYLKCSLNLMLFVHIYECMYSNYRSMYFVLQDESTCLLTAAMVSKIFYLFVNGGYVMHDYPISY